LNLLASFGLRSFVAASRLRGSNQDTTPKRADFDKTGSAA
jgi:hypothetical protein